jgi:outer membrane lipoprotein SlyB
MTPIKHLIASVVLAFILLLPFAPTALAQHNDNFYRGAQRHQSYNDNYDRRRYRDDRHQGGIGPGKGALIGGASGAVLGTIFGGGAKGALIGGAAGAGVGAISGKANQDRRDHDYRDRDY